MVKAVDFAFAPAAEADFERLLALRLLVMRAHLERIGRFDPARARQRFRDGYAPIHTRLILVAGELAGCIALIPDESGRELTNFYLYPGHQGAGLGSAVMAGVTAEADASQSLLHLQVLKQSPAVRLYERHGFRHTHDDEWDRYLSRASIG